MIEPLEDLPEGVIGFEAVGEIHASDYKEVLRPALERAAAAEGIRLVYVLGDRFEGYSSGASWQDSKLAFEHHKRWKRIRALPARRARHCRRMGSLRRRRPAASAAVVGPGPGSRARSCHSVEVRWPTVVTMIR